MHFRMYRSTFNKLLNVLMRSDNTVVKKYRGGNLPVRPEKGLQITLWYMAKESVMATVADRFDVSVSTVFTIRNMFIKCLSELRTKFIVWPNSTEKALIKEKFKNISGFPGVIGAIDGSHITIVPNVSQQTSYQNRYGTHSILLQAICNSDKIFTNVTVGFPGACNDAHVLANSYIFKKIAENGGGSYFSDTDHIIGDKIYPLKKWLLVPFKGLHLREDQSRYNKALSKTRVKIENAFSLLKIRWRRLNNMYVLRLDIRPSDGQKSIDSLKPIREPIVSS